MAIKVIFVGPMGAGKTTAISAISDIPPVKTEAKNNDKTIYSKETTTVAMDYGELLLEDGNKLALYGIPGQRHFSFIWPIVAKGSLGSILLLDCSQASWSEELEYYVNTFRSHADDGAMVIGLNRVKDTDEASNIMQKFSLNFELALPFFFTDPRESNDVNLLLEALIVNAELDILLQEE
jgi:signal recognition particle receptor subunit beta